GTFNPPHNGHIALAATAEERFGEEVVVLVAVRPGHKEVELDGDVRVQLARAAFPDREVETDPYGRTVDMLKAGRWREPRFLIGADEFCDFLSWKDPEGVIAQARLGVATRPGYPRARLENVLAELSDPARVTFFDLAPFPISSREIRDRVARGEPIDGLVPPAVEALIHDLGLYRGYT